MNKEEFNKLPENEKCHTAAMRAYDLLDLDKYECMTGDIVDHGDDIRNDIDSILENLSDQGFKFDHSGAANCAFFLV